MSSIRTLAIAAIAVLAVALPAQAAPSERTTSAVLSFADLSVTGTSTLVRNDSGVAMSLHTSGLTPGHAVTVWWVLFNNPDECTTGVPFRCGEPDLFDPDVEASVLAATGHVIGASGSANFGAYLAEGDASECAFGADFLCGDGLQDARVADVHLVVRDHGPAIPGVVPEQIHTFGGGCDVNACADLQFAVHES